MYPPARQQMFAFAIPAAVLALATTCLLLITQTEAGGKGKGGRGHIIVQNEVKGNQVPVYMPIPIPIPMPVGPHPPPPPPPHHGEGHSKMFQHSHGFGHDDDGEGEVRKIYLLQPMPKPRPQPQLKGGGFMGPIQNHIHLSSQEQLTSPGKHRHAASYGGAHQQQQQQLPQHQQEGDGDLRPLDKHTGIKSASSEVKILPIVVIPPVAPMPPIQLPSSQSNSNTHRLMFSPQFNNFLVTNDKTKRRQKNQGFTYNAGDTFAEYGGSVGGSVFRDNFVGRGRSARSRMSLNDALNQATSSRSRDFDYADFDYDNPQATVTQSAYRRSFDEPAQLARRRYHRMTSSGSFPIQRRYQRQFMPQTGEANRYKSIRGIIEGHKASRFEDYDQSVNNDQPVDYVGGENDSNGLSESQTAALLNSRFGRNQSPAANFEISLDDLSNQLAAADSQQQNRLHGVPNASSSQDLSSLYYDHGDLASSSSKVASRPSSLSQTIGSPERDIFDEDQWRFDSIKSVKHVAAANATMTHASNSTSSFAVQSLGTKSISVRKKMDPLVLKKV